MIEWLRNPRSQTKHHTRKLTLALILQLPVKVVGRMESDMVAIFTP